MLFTNASMLFIIESDSKGDNKMENNKLERFKKFTSNGSKYYFFKSSNEIIKLAEENRSYLDASEQKEKRYAKA